MSADYPAAHSMDSCWFAVDAQGQVAYFDTGEGGAVPVADAFPKGGEAGVGDPFELDGVVIALLQRKAEGHTALSDLLFDRPGWTERLREALWEAEQAALVGLLAWLGVYLFDCSAPHAAPYVRGAWVPDPITVDALPAALRDRLAAARLPVVFAGAPRVAVPALVEAAGWGDPWEDLDGKLFTFEGAPFDDEAGEWRDGLSVAEEGDGVRAFDDAQALALLAELLQPGPAGPADAPPPAPPTGGLFAWFKSLFRA